MKKTIISFLSLIIILTSSMVWANDKKAAPEKKGYFTEDTKRKLYVREYFLGNSAVGLGVDYFFTPFFWAGLDLGLSFLPSMNEGRNYYILYPQIETGIFIHGKVEEDVRIGIGINGGVYTILPGEDWTAQYSKPAYGLTMAAYGIYEWKFLFVRLGVIYDGGSISPWTLYPVVGFRF